MKIRSLAAAAILAAAPAALLTTAAVSSASSAAPVARAHPLTAQLAAASGSGSGQGTVMCDYNRPGSQNTIYEYYNPHCPPTIFEDNYLWYLSKETPL